MGSFNNTHQGLMKTDNLCIISSRWSILCLQRTSEALGLFGHFGLHYFPQRLHWEDRRSRDPARISVAPEGGAIRSGMVSLVYQSQSYRGGRVRESEEPGFSSGLPGRSRRMAKGDDLWVGAVGRVAHSFAVVD